MHVILTFSLQFSAMSTDSGVEELRHGHSGSSVESSGATDSVDSATASMSLSSYAEVSSPDAPRPVQIVVSKPDHTFDLDHEALQEILLSDEVRDKKVVILSVAGAFRKGKSFLLDFLLRYLDRNGSDKSNDWMGREDEPLKGFSWRGGIERNTMGILMWSKPFIVTLPSTGEEVAILLLDTQGAFDNQSTVKDCATIFALSTMIASLQVYNLSTLIHEPDLHHLHLFTDYGRLAMESSDVKPFQSLCFLIRDWSNPDDYPYGRDGGSAYIDTVLKVTKEQHQEIQMVREHIRSCFETVFCFLMPHPGLKVATNKKFDGRLSDIDTEFKNHLGDLAPLLLSPENLIVKKINGNPITGRGLLECFKVYMKIFQSEELPQPKSLLEATAEANNLTAQAAAFDRYNKEMDALCGADNPYLSPEKLQEKHKEIMEACITQFRSTRKLGGGLYSERYEKKLEEQIKEVYELFVKRNESKHILNAYRTPVVLTLLIVLSYIVSSILDFLGVESLSKTAVWGLYVPLLLVAVWMYVRYSGNFREVGEMIDNVTTAVWENVLQPVYAVLMQQAMQQAVRLATKEKRD